MTRNLPSLRRRLPASALAVLLLALAILARTAVAATVETDHYVITLVGERAEAEGDAIGSMLEQLYPHMVEHFDAEPDLEHGARLQLFFADEKRGFDDRLAADGQPAIGGGGYYSPGMRIAYGWRQPQDYDTRALILHEAAHQFHFLTRTGNHNPNVGWFVEGVAEYLGNHHWDGETLTVAVRPWITPKDYFARALEGLESERLTLGDIVCGEAGGYPEAWALYTYLFTHEGWRERRRFKRIARIINACEYTDDTFAEVMGDPDELQEEFVEWLRAEQQPLKQVWGWWQHTGEGQIYAESPRTGIALVKQPTHSIEVAIPAPPPPREADTDSEEDNGDNEGDTEEDDDGTEANESEEDTDDDADDGEEPDTVEEPEPPMVPYRVGLVVDFTDTRNFLLVFIQNGRELRVHRYAGGRWTIEARHALDAVPLRESCRFTLTATRNEDGSEVTVTVNGVEITTLTVTPEGMMGFTADSTTLTFESVEWETR